MQMPRSKKRELIEEIDEVKDLKAAIEFELKLEVECLLKEFEEIKKEIVAEEIKEGIQTPEVTSGARFRWVKEGDGWVMEIERSIDGLNT